MATYLGAQFQLMTSYGSLDTILQKPLYRCFLPFWRVNTGRTIHALTSKLRTHTLLMGSYYGAQFEVVTSYGSLVTIARKPL